MPACVQNNSLPYMVCQQTNTGVFDLGSTMGFDEIAPGLLNVSFNYGTPVRCVVDARPMCGSMCG